MAKKNDKPPRDKLHSNTPEDYPVIPTGLSIDLPEVLIEQVVRAYDDLGEVVALHQWVYDAIHAQLTSDVGFEARYHDLGLSLLLGWLKQRDDNAKDNLRKILEQMRKVSGVSKVEEPRLLYYVTTG